MVDRVDLGSAIDFGLQPGFVHMFNQVFDDEG